MDVQVLLPLPPPSSVSVGVSPARRETHTKIVSAPVVSIADAVVPPPFSASASDATGEAPQVRKACSDATDGTDARKACVGAGGSATSHSPSRHATSAWYLRVMRPPRGCTGSETPMDSA
jgi:hypothetical protein